MSRIEELEKRLAADPNSRIFVQLAEEYRKQGLLDNAIEVCEEGLQKHPQYPSARVALGRALLEAENFDRASEEFEAVLARIPDNILANKFLGETYHRLGRYDEAIQKYQIAQTLAPEDPELEEKIEAVKAEKAAGGPPPPSAPPEASEVPEVPVPEVDDADETAVAPPSEPVAAAPPSPEGPSAVPAPDAPPVPAPLEPTLAESGPPVPGEEAPSPPEAEETPPEEDLAPIPLVDVDEPMVLEGSPYANLSSEPEPPPPSEPIPIVPSMEMPEQPAPSGEPEPPTPPTMEPEPMLEEPASAMPTEPAPPEPPPLEPPPMEPPAPETPPTDTARMEPPPPGAPPPPIDVTPETATGDDIDTPTMAELYASQGHFDKAILVYRNLLSRNPDETSYRERIEELEMLMKATSEPSPTPRMGRTGGADPQTQQTIQLLEGWLDGIRRSRRA